MLNLDTHILVMACLGGLTPNEHAVLSGSDWGISDIVLWEIEMLASKGRISKGLDDPHFRAVVQSGVIWPISVEVAMASCRLDFDGDPSDRLIAATSIVHRAPLLTRDGKILQSKRVPFAL